jgi:hypothetical protein
MPKLLRSSETSGCGATIRLDSGEVVYVSIARAGVLVRHWDMSGGFFKTFIGNFTGAKLYNEINVYKGSQTAIALRLTFPDQAPELNFKSPLLSAFSNAIWHCGSAAEVSITLNEAAAKLPQLEQDADAATMLSAFEAAKNYPPKRPPEMTPATYRVIYSDGVTQETRLIPAEIEKWVTASNKAEADKPYRIVRVLDPEGRVVWQKVTLASDAF